MQKYREAKIRYVASEIERMADDLGLEEQLTTQALRLFKNTIRQDIDGNRLDDTSTACLYGAIRMYPGEAGTTFRDVAAVARIEDSRIQTVSTRIFDDLGLKVPPPDPRPTLEDACEVLGIEDQTDILVEVLDGLNQEVRNKAPTTVAGGVLFAGQYLEACSYEVKQQQASEAVGSTNVSLRSVYRGVLFQVHQNMELRVEEHRFRDFDSAFSIMQEIHNIPDTVRDTAEGRLREHRESEGSFGSLEGPVCAAVYLSIQETDELQRSVEELTENVGVTKHTVRKYINDMEGS